MMDVYLFVIIACLFAMELLYFKIADKCNIIDKPNLRSSHTQITLRGGGIIFLLGAWIYTLFYGFTYPYFLGGLTLIAGVSFLDDVRSVPNWLRLIVHFMAMLLMLSDLDIQLLDAWWMVVVALVFSVGVINAFNFMDGINGLTGGYSLSVLLPLLYLNYSFGFVDHHFLLVILLSVAVFCVFNFRDNAKCFAGDVGAVGIAFIILFLLGRLVLYTHNLTYFLLLVVYGVDAGCTIVHRILLHENLGEAHRKHLYQLMANELKIPHVIVSSIYMLLQLFISFGLICLPVNDWGYFFLICVVLVLGYVLFVRRNYHLHKEYLEMRL